MVEEEYEVEKILNHKIEKKGKKYSIEYLIKWLGYGDADCTWEAEGNVFAVDMVVNYWQSIPRDDPDRQLFERIQSSKKRPILIPDSTLPESSPTQIRIPRTVASSSSPVAAPEPKKQQKLNNFFSQPQTTTSSNGKEKEKEHTEPMDIEREPSPKRLPLVIANDEHDDLDEDDELEESSKENAAADSDFNAPPQDSTASSDVEVIEHPPATQKKTLKRKKPGYSDYFLEEHERKKRLEGDYDSTDSEVVSIASDAKETDTVIFDDYYGTDPPMDWINLAEKVVYIGKELPESPLYCIIQWKDGVKSVHPLSLVRDKRPDLVK